MNNMLMDASKVMKILEKVIKYTSNNTKSK